MDTLIKIFGMPEVSQYHWRIALILALVSSGASSSQQATVQR